MSARILLLLLTAAFLANAAVISAVNLNKTPASQSVCDCNTTITKYFSHDLLPRQNCPAPVTVTIVRAPPLATIVSGDPSSVASSFSFASQIDSMKHEDSSQDRPTGEPPETTPIFYTHTALGPAVVGTDDPNDNSILYHNIGTTVAPVATTTVSFPAEVTPAQKLNVTNTAISRHVTTVTTYLSTVTVTPSRTTSSASFNQSFAGRGLQKRQTCSMIFASIGGQWASWCNEWNGHTIVKYSTYDTTVLITHPAGGDPIPSSVYAPHDTPNVPETIQTSPPEASTSTLPHQTSTAALSSLISEASSVISSILVTASVVVTYPITTITQTMVDTVASSSSEVPAPSPSCGQVGQFVVSFDDLPEFSTSNPDNETTAPPVLDRYSHFYWSNGYGYGPPPNEPFHPHDGERLAEYSPTSEPLVASSDVQGRDLPGSFGAGPRAWNNIFWFDAKSAYIGCNTTISNGPCEVIASGYRWISSNAPNASKYEGSEVVAFTQKFALPGPCVNKPCDLSQILFDITKFNGLSTLNIAATVGGAKAGFYLDSFQAAWTNSTCDAGLERSAIRK